MIKGNLRKMIGKLGEDGLVSYKLPIGDENIDLNKHLGHKITLEVSKYHKLHRLR